MPKDIIKNVAGPAGPTEPEKGVSRWAWGLLPVALVGIYLFGDSIYAAAHCQRVTEIVDSPINYEVCEGNTVYYQNIDGVIQRKGIMLGSKVIYNDGTGWHIGSKQPINNGR